MASTITRRALLSGAAALGTGASLSAVRAQSYPNKFIKIVLPYTAGSPNDVIVRLVAPRLTASLGQNVIVDNRPGGGTLVGTKTVQTSEPDGHTLLAASINFVMAPSLSANADYEPLKDFAPVAMIGGSPFVLVIAPSLPVQTVQELVAYSKTNPGKLNFGFGQGTAPHMIGEMLKKTTGADIASIPYKGGAAAVTDMLGGRIHMNVGTPPTLLPLIREGKLRALAVTSDTRSPDLPAVPTMAESGYPALALTYWMGLLAAAGTPASAIARLNGDINASLNAADVKANMAKLGFEPRPSTQQDFTTFLAEQQSKWTVVVKTTGIKIE